ncbi:MAG: tRNA uridine-5-carboxymethylaminomethyl(34) synthesis enzyme MnmG [Lentisphaeria bacterium]|nr:tRNA uridine-5-carboxymethylaminomethyl(34) synthesis enzyme MnmG [Lentisphaeria bacterium]
MPEEYYDVIVIGGGHAACEAAYASARLGASTLMLTINLDHIAQMSCNPCIGGIAKGHLVREIDALGGAMGQIADASSIQFRMLNRTKGPAVWSPRSQCDKVAYQRSMKRLLELTPNLTIKQSQVTSFLLDGDAVCGVETEFGDLYKSKSVVVATGTFLAGKMHFGLRSFPGGRAGDPPSVALAAAFREQLHLHTGRLKTGTPPRLLGSSIDFSGLDTQPSEDADERFSFFPDDSIRPESHDKNMVCYLTHTDARAAELVRSNLDKAPMYNGLIHGIGTRYCPSFEDKIVRFPDHERHHIYLEPEGEYTGEYYLNGLSTSLPPEIQLKILRTIPGLEHAKVTRYAYAIEYDFVFPEELDRTLHVRKWKGLYHAGQINGTSGYEEAAGQGLLAGLNAARYAAGKDGVELGRDSSYLGVLADDITTKEIVEPYRLFTSRAEHRLSLRQDNADFRLCPSAYEWGLLPQEKYDRFCAYAEKCEKTEALCRSIRRSGRNLWDALKDCKGDCEAEPPKFEMAEIGLDPENATDRRVLRHLAIQTHYEGYMRQEEQAIRRLRALEAWRIPEDFDYSSLPGLRNESRMKLQKVRPGTLAQAGRIDGVTPSEISLLQVFLMRARHTPKDTEQPDA